MKGLMLVGPNIEDGEAILTRDLLLRANLKLDLVNVNNDSYYLKTAYGLEIKANYLFNEVNLADYNFLVIPGGKWVFEQLENPQEIVTKVIKKFYNQKKLVAAICAAPMYLGKAGVLTNKDFTCYPSCETSIPGNYLKNQKVVRVDNVITSKGLGAVFEFSYEIIKYLLGEEVAAQVYQSTHYK